jgi:hypothetical protein
MTDSAELAALMEPVARKLLGEPNHRMSSKTELRFRMHGSLSVDLKQGTWYDHEISEGGDPVDLVILLGLACPEACKWITGGSVVSRPRLGVGGDRRRD